MTNLPFIKWSLFLLSLAATTTSTPATMGVFPSSETDSINDLYSDKYFINFSAWEPFIVPFKMPSINWAGLILPSIIWLSKSLWFCAVSVSPGIDKWIILTTGLPSISPRTLIPNGEPVTVVSSPLTINRPWIIGVLIMVLSILIPAKTTLPTSILNLAIGLFRASSGLLALNCSIASISDSDIASKPFTIDLIILRRTPAFDFISSESSTSFTIADADKLFSSRFSVLLIFDVNHFTLETTCLNPWELVDKGVFLCSVSTVSLLISPDSLTSVKSGWANGNPSFVFASLCKALIRKIASLSSAVYPSLFLLWKYSVNPAIVPRPLLLTPSLDHTAKYSTALDAAVSNALGIGDWIWRIVDKSIAT